MIGRANVVDKLWTYLGVTIVDIMGLLGEYASIPRDPRSCTFSRESWPPLLHRWTYRPI